MIIYKLYIRRGIWEQVLCSKYNLKTPRFAKIQQQHIDCAREGSVRQWHSRPHWMAEPLLRWPANWRFFFNDRYSRKTQGRWWKRVMVTRRNPSIQWHSDTIGVLCGKCICVFVWMVKASEGLLNERTTGWHANQPAPTETNRCTKHARNRNVTSKCTSKFVSINSSKKGGCEMWKRWSSLRPQLCLRWGELFSCVRI